MTRYFAGLIVALALAACSLPKMDPEAEALARKAYAQLTTGDDAGLEAELEPEYRGAKARAMFAQIRTLIPKGQAAEPKLVGFNAYAGTGGSTLTLTHAYAYPQSTVTARTMLTKGKDGAWLIRGFNVSVSAGAEIAPAPAAPPERPHKPRPVA
jgi:hypothetical protein